MRITIKIPPMENAEFRRRMSRALSKVAFDMEAEAKRMCPVDNGRLRNSIHAEIQGNKIVIGTGLNYAPYVEYGTAPHIIEPRDKKALAFEWTDIGGTMVGRKGRMEAGIPAKKANTVVLKKVYHPGTEPQPFIRPALHKAINVFLERRIREEFGG